MDQLLSWLQPAVIIGVVLFTSNLTNRRISDLQTNLNKRIDDLRVQMTREHDVLASKVDESNKILMEHITDRGSHRT